jgi:methylated-DNA-[protein]-cysteine S-methyltransferase
MPNEICTTDESFVIATTIGRLEIDIDDEKIKAIKLNSNKSLSKSKTKLGQKITEQFKCYFNNASFEFDLPLVQKGSEHQNKVWKALREIPPGQVLTYGALAKKIGSSARAIGNACRNNPIPIIVPCHRIVAAKDIGGFSGAQEGVLLNIKRELLAHEGLSF